MYTYTYRHTHVCSLIGLSVNTCVKELYSSENTRGITHGEESEKKEFPPLKEGSLIVRLYSGRKYYVCF